MYTNVDDGEILQDKLLVRERVMFVASNVALAACFTLSFPLPLLSRSTTCIHLSETFDALLSSFHWLKLNQEMEHMLVDQSE